MFFRISLVANGILIATIIALSLQIKLLNNSIDKCRIEKDRYIAQTETLEQQLNILNNNCKKSIQKLKENIKDQKEICKKIIASNKKLEDKLNEIDNL